MYYGISKSTSTFSKDIFMPFLFAVAVLFTVEICSLTMCFRVSSLTPAETSDGTGPSCPWCPCGLAAPDRAGVWSSTPSGARTPSLWPPSTVGSHSWSAAAVPGPCTAVHPSRTTCPGRSQATGGTSVSVHNAETSDLHNSLMQFHSDEVYKLFPLSLFRNQHCWYNKHSSQMTVIN